MRIQSPFLQLAMRLLPLIPSPALSLASSVEVPLHLEPNATQPFNGKRAEVASAAIDGGLFIVYDTADQGCAPMAISLLEDGSFSNPIPLLLSDFMWRCGSSLAVGQVGGDALAAWQQSIGIEERVIAVLQPHEEWTYVTRPKVDLGIGDSPAVVAAGDFGLLAFANSNGLVVVRFDAAAWPAHSAPVVIAQGAMSSFTKVSGAFGPAAGRAMFVWRSGTSIYGSITDANGSPLTSPVILTTGNFPSVSWNGIHFVVAWSATGGSIVCKRFDSNGVSLDPQPIVVANSPGHAPATASSTGETLVSWVGEDTTPTYRVRAARVSAAGTVLDPGGFLVYEGVRPNWTEALNQVMDVAPLSSGYHVTWIENRPSCGGIITDLQDFLGAVVSPGTPPTTGPALILSASGQQIGVAAAIVSDRFWTTWHTKSRSSPRVMGARRDATGLLLDPLGISMAGIGVCVFDHATFYNPVADGNAGLVLTAWRQIYQNQTSDQMTIRYCAYNSAGIRVRCDDQLIYANRWNLGPTPLAVAARDSNFLIAYTATVSDSVVIAWAGVNNAVNLIAQEHLDLGFGETIEDATSNGDDFLVSWSMNGEGRDSFLGRIDSSFNLLDLPGIVLAGGQGDQVGARLASDGDKYLAAWPDGESIRGARVDAQGTVLDPGGVVVATVATGATFDIDWDGTHYILAWGETVGDLRLVRLKRIAPDLSSPDPFPIELDERHDLVQGCRVTSRDGASLVSFTRAQPPDGLPTGHGILYHNPAVTTAVSPSQAPVPLLSGVAPNPFRTNTEIMTGPLAGRPGILRIVDASGRIVHETPAPQALGHIISWDGRDANGRPLPSGTYFYELSTPETTLRGKLIKLR